MGALRRSQAASWAEHDREPRFRHRLEISTSVQRFRMPTALSFEGVYPILATPFDDQENLDLPSMQRLVSFMADLPVDGVTILGVSCIKEEAPPTLGKISVLLAGMTTRRVPVLTALGALYGVFELQRGSSGFNTGFAFPEILTAMLQHARAGRMNDAQTLYRRFLPLIVFEQQPGVAIRKEILRCAD